MKLGKYRLPRGAKHEASLAMYQPLDAPGIYYTLARSGELQNVGLAGQPRGHSIPGESSQQTCCIALLTLGRDGKSGSFQGAMSRTVYQANGHLSESSAYSDSDTDVGPAGQSFPRWAQACIDHMVAN